MRTGEARWLTSGSLQLHEEILSEDRELLRVIEHIHSNTLEDNGNSRSNASNLSREDRKEKKRKEKKRKEKKIK